MVPNLSNGQWWLKFELYRNRTADTFTAGTLWLGCLWTTGSGHKKQETHVQLWWGLEKTPAWSHTQSHNWSSANEFTTRLCTRDLNRGLAETVLPFSFSRPPSPKKWSLYILNLIFINSLTVSIPSPYHNFYKWVTHIYIFDWMLIKQSCTCWIHVEPGYQILARVGLGYFLFARVQATA